MDREGEEVDVPNFQDLASSASEEETVEVKKGRSMLYELDRRTLGKTWRVPLCGAMVLEIKSAFDLSHAFGKGKGNSRHGQPALEGSEDASLLNMD